MDQKKLDKILKLHKRWLDDEEGGVKADLKHANLRDANLKGANLIGADLTYANFSGANLDRITLKEKDIKHMGVYLEEEK